MWFKKCLNQSVKGILKKHKKRKEKMTLEREEEVAKVENVLPIPG